MRKVVLGLLSLLAVVSVVMAGAPTITQGVNYAYEEYVLLPIDTMKGSADTTFLWQNFNTPLAGDLILHCTGLEKGSGGDNAATYKARLYVQELTSAGTIVNTTPTLIDSLSSTASDVYIPRYANNMRIWLWNVTAGDTIKIPRIDVELRKSVTVTKAR